MITIFSTGRPSEKVVEELQRAVAANPEEVAVGTDPNIDLHTLSYNHAKFGAFVRSAQISPKFCTKPPDLRLPYRLLSLRNTASLYTTRLWSPKTLDQSYSSV